MYVDFLKKKKKDKIIILEKKNNVIKTSSQIVSLMSENIIKTVEVEGGGGRVRGGGGVRGQRWNHQVAVVRHDVVLHPRGGLELLPTVLTGERLLHNTVTLVKFYGVFKPRQAGGELLYFLFL